MPGGMKRSYIKTCRQKLKVAGFFSAYGLLLLSGINQLTQLAVLNLQSQ